MLMTTTDLIDRARAGDGDAFRALTEPHRRELHVHCYRMLGSLHDADDALQETLLAAWNGLAGFEGRASLRTWLYRVATNRCLNALRSRRRRRPQPWAVPGVEPPEPTGLGEVSWLEPYPDGLLDPDPSVDPAARYQAREAISLAFVTALQVLPPRQRAVLVLRDVLSYHADEVASMLDTTVASVTSALKRARESVDRRACAGRAAPVPVGSAVERTVLDRLVAAYESGDVDAVVALLTDDATFAMPPVPFEYHGREAVRRFTETVVFRQARRYRLVPTAANGQPALAAYVDAGPGAASPSSGVMVIALRGDRVSAITRFDASLLDRFGLPVELPPSEM